MSMEELQPISNLQDSTDLDQETSTPSYIPNVTKMFEASYPTLSPILLSHARRLWVTGTVGTFEDVAHAIKRIDSRVDLVQVITFLKDHANSIEWKEERQRILQSQYEAIIRDEEKIREPINYKYNRIYDRLFGLVSARVTAIEDEIEDEDCAPTIKHTKEFRIITSVLKDLHEGQLTTRGLASKESNVNVNVKNEMNGEYYEIESRILDGTEFVKDVEAEVLDPIGENNVS